MTYLSANYFGGPVIGVKTGGNGRVWAFDGSGMYYNDGLGWKALETPFYIWWYWNLRWDVDVSGNLWLMNDGLFRFDGNTWTPHSIPSDLTGLFDLSAAPDGDVWLAGSGAVFQWHGGNWKTWQYDAGGSIMSVKTAPDGAVWAGIGGRGVYRLVKGNWKQMLSFTLWNSNHLTITPNGAVWTIVDRGVACFNGKAWKYYSKENGLASDSVTSIAVAPDSTVWIGTSDSGASRFDGSSWKTYTVADGLASNDVLSIACDCDGVVWFGTDKGVTRYDPQFQYWRPADPEPAPVIDFSITNYRGRGLQPFLTFQDSTLWYGNGEGLFQRNVLTGEEKRIELEGNSLPHEARCFAEAPDGSLWVNAGRGVARYREGSWKRFTPTDGLTGSDTRRIAVTADGNVWAMTDSTGIFRFDGNSWMQYTTRDGLMYPDSGTMEVAPDGALWAVTHFRFGTEGTGFRNDSAISRFDGVQWVCQGQFSSCDITALGFRGDGTLWAGASGLFGQNGRMLVFDASGWREMGECPFRGSVFSVRGTPDGSVWVGAENGVWRFDGRNWRGFAKNDGFPEREVPGLAVDSGGTVWANTSTSILRWNGTLWEEMRSFGGSHLSNAVRSVVIDSLGTVWVGSDLGISRFDGQSWDAAQPHIGQLNSMAVGENGVLWSGWDDGLYRYDGVAWKQFSRDDGLTDIRYVRALALDGDDEVYFSAYARRSEESWKWANINSDGGEWVVQPGNGGKVDWTVLAPDGAFWLGTNIALYRYINGESQSFAVWRDLPGSEIHLLTCTSEGTVWAATDAGVFRYRNHTWKSVWYTPDPNTIVNSIAADAKGRIWLGTTNGAVVYNARKWQWITTEQGLPDNMVTAVAIHPDNSVWIGTSGGLARLIPRYSEVTPDPDPEPDPDPDPDPDPTPVAFALKGNFPNPFNPTTLIQFAVPMTEYTELTIYSINGQKVRTLLSGQVTGGVHSVVWNGQDDSGKSVSSGVYIAHLQAGKQVASRRMAMVK